ncbi:type IV toxin-antitoxin system AbiEi family antitoxin domain-containing protein [Homoserinibacter sp. YIM 151385]|uniref:type IV toxin-antitoxin system AbiEi family antitoxin domain-containing protein n=1 Tax=Homoserinibacter sp. YIM 151385 TaxID=2985506 RepID=UPI0022F1412C|nr:type IV toxin-antitoxin system AbiEi family antitoxin domain-containing protein [Homoserinibacter sp. YIM 151385]WBU36836.1 type IV toxin-antitoxin system AbiEi family antitoxin domain-containing protein [Homoserinibacter sp. YIM 151385]
MDARIWTTAELRARGIRRRGLERQLDDGVLQRLRRGWYATAGVDPAVAAAVRAGGRLACCSALAAMGVWTLLPDDRTHVQLDAHETTVRRSADVRLHWAPLSDPGDASRGAVGIVDALLQASGCLDRLPFVAAVDSAMHLGLLREWQLDELRAALPAERRSLLDHVESTAESGLESIMRVALRDLGLAVTAQSWIGGVGPTDLDVEAAVAVETDGDRWHDATVSTRDRERDAGFILEGRTVLHFRYAQVVYSLDWCVGVVIAALEVHRGVPDGRRKAARARRRLARAVPRLGDSSRERA